MELGDTSFCFNFDREDNDQPQEIFGCRTLAQTQSLFRNNMSVPGPDFLRVVSLIQHGV